MSLCRWSHSPFYIYEECGSDYNEIKVTGEGTFTSDEILSNPIKNVYKYARDSGYEIAESIELLIWLYPWALANKDKWSWEFYNKILEFTRFVSYIRSYVLNSDSNNFEYISGTLKSKYRDLMIWIDNDPIHKLPWEEKRKIFEEEGYLRKKNG